MLNHCSQVDRFATYEQYQSNYDLVQRDIDETQRNIASWAEYDKGIENLSAHVNPVRSQEANRKKALTVKDLLIKVRVLLSLLLFGATDLLLACSTIAKICSSLRATRQLHSRLR